MSVVSSHSRPQSDEQPRSTIFSPANFSGPRKAKRGTTDHSQSSASDLLDEYKARPRHRDSLSVPQPLQQQSSGSISIHHANPSPQRLRRRNKEPTMSHLAGTSALSQDSHFEKMLALLEVDDSLPDTADRRSASGDNGANVFYTPRRSRDLESHHSHPRTPSPSLPVLRQIAHSSITPQQSTSFEQLRQIVSATSPNSKPRRRRQNLAATRSAEMESHAERSTENDREIDTSRPLSRLHRETDSSAQMAQTSNLSEDTPRRRRQRGGTQQRAINPVSGRPAHSSPTRRRQNGVETGEHKSMQQQHQSNHMPPERHSAVRQRWSQNLKDTARPESLASSISITESSRSRSDFFDTAPPSDLDLRFPALSPQPSPLNSRRRRESRQDRDIRHADAEPARYQMRADSPQFRAKPVAAPISEFGVPDIDLRWQSTKRLVDTYMQSRRSDTAHASPNASDHDPVHSALRSSPKHQVQETMDPANMARLPNRAMTDRLDSVAEEVRALRQQVTELHSMLDFLVSGRGYPITLTKKASRREDSFRRTSEDEDSIENLPSPIVNLLVHLDTIVRRHVQPKGRDDTTDTSLDGTPIAQICEQRNLDFLRTHITSWERELRRE